MGKQVIRLTEEDLHNIISESVKRYLNEAEFDGEMDEGLWNYMKGFTQKPRQAAANSIKRGANAVGSAIKNGANAVGSAMKNGANNIGTAFKNAHQQGMAAHQQGVMDNRKKEISKGVKKYVTMLYQNGGLSQGIYNNVMAAVDKYDGSVKDPRVARQRKAPQQQPQQLNLDL